MSLPRLSSACRVTVDRRRDQPNNPGTRVVLQGGPGEDYGDDIVQTDTDAIRANPEDLNGRGQTGGQEDRNRGTSGRGDRGDWSSDLLGDFLRRNPNPGVPGPLPERHFFVGDSDPPFTVVNRRERDLMVVTWGYRTIVRLPELDDDPTANLGFLFIPGGVELTVLKRHHAIRPAGPGARRF